MVLKLRSEPRSWKRWALGATKFEPKMKSDPGTWGRPPTTPKVSQGLGRGSSPTLCSNLTVYHALLEKSLLRLIIKTDTHTLHTCVPKVLCICLFWCRHILNVLSSKWVQNRPFDILKLQSDMKFTPDRMEATKIPKTATRSPKMKQNMSLWRLLNLHMSSKPY